MSGIKASRTTPYHPMSNGQCERMNRSLIAMLKTLSEKEKADWKNHLSKLAYAYNVTVHSTTKYSPYFLLFGRNPKLPIDEIFEPVSNDRIQKSYKNYVDDWQKAMKEAFEIVRENSKKGGEGNKRRYNEKVKGVGIDVGDRVLLRNNSERGGTGKLRNYWESTVYKVVKKDDDIPVLDIIPEDGGRKVKRVHRNNVMKCSDVMIHVDKGVEEKKEKRGTAKKDDIDKSVGKKKKERETAKKDDVDVESEDEEIVLITQRIIDDGETSSDNVTVDEKLSEDTETLDMPGIGENDDLEYSAEQDIEESEFREPSVIMEETTSYQMKR